MSTHLTVRYGEHGEEYPIRITFRLFGYHGLQVHDMTEQYTQTGLDEHGWEEYYSMTDVEVDRWTEEIYKSLSKGFTTVSKEFVDGDHIDIL